MAWKKGESGNPGGKKRSETVSISNLRQHIPTKKIIDFLVNVVGNPKHYDIETKDKVSAARILLNKVLPDQKSVEVGNKGGQPLQLVIKHYD